MRMVLINTDYRVLTIRNTIEEWNNNIRLLNEEIRLKETTYTGLDKEQIISKLEGLKVVAKNTIQTMESEIKEYI